MRGAVDICQRIRNGTESASCLPQNFVVPALSFGAQSLADLINWETESLTELLPLRTVSLSTNTKEQLRERLRLPVDEAELKGLIIERYPRTLI